MITHLPHASPVIPAAAARADYLVDGPTLRAEVEKLTDWYTDELFAYPGATAVRAEFSRVYCDVERFADDAQEPMAAFGMGVLYATTDASAPLRDVSPARRESILREVYWPHHRRLDAAVDAELAASGRALIVDGHSFASTPFDRDRSKRTPRPDFNVGTDSYHTPAALVEASRAYFRARGCSLGVDWPYDGALVPLKHYRRTPAVASIMLEVNRALYLEEPSARKSKGFDRTRELVRGWMTEIEKVFDRG